MTTTGIRYRNLVTKDLPSLIHMWEITPGIGMGKGDTIPELEYFLDRNPGLSKVAVNHQEDIIGSVLCGHDGRRGFLYHLAVIPAYRKQGIAKKILELVVLDLQKLNIKKCNILVLNNNHEGVEFWQKIGWNFRENLHFMQKDILD